MFGKKSPLTPLQLRKQLLIAESNLNRDQLSADMAAITSGIRAFADRAKFFGSITSSAALLVTGLMAFRRRSAVDANAKPSWLQTVFKGAGMVSTLWLALRSKRCDQKDK